MIHRLIIYKGRPELPPTAFLTFQGQISSGTLCQSLKQISFTSRVAVRVCGKTAGKNQEETRSDKCSLPRWHQRGAEHVGIDAA